MLTAPCLFRLHSAEFYRDAVIPAMSTLRKTVDSLEMVVDAKIWPLPSYAEMLFMR